jgi:hypothetical protein
VSTRYEDGVKESSGIEDRARDLARFAVTPEALSATYMFSCAISLKRIADALDVSSTLRNIASDVSRIADKTHS